MKQFREIDGGTGNGHNNNKNITIREIDLSVMNDGNGLVQWLTVGRFVRGWKAMEHCDADWQRRSTQEAQFAFSLHLRLTSFSCVVWHWHTRAHTHIQKQTQMQINLHTWSTGSDHEAVPSVQRLTLLLSLWDNMGFENRSNFYENRPNGAKIFLKI